MKNWQMGPPSSYSAPLIMCLMCWVSNWTSWRTSCLLDVPLLLVSLPPHLYFSRLILLQCCCRGGPSPHMLVPRVLLPTLRCVCPSLPLLCLFTIPPRLYWPISPLLHPLLAPPPTQLSGSIVEDFLPGGLSPCHFLLSVAYAAGRQSHCNIGATGSHIRPSPRFVKVMQRLNHTSW